jgi:hypothetical protein
MIMADASLCGSGSWRVEVEHLLIKPSNNSTTPKKKKSLSSNKGLLWLSVEIKI